MSYLEILNEELSKKEKKIKLSKAEIDFLKKNKKGEISIYEVSGWNRRGKKITYGKADVKRAKKLESLGYLEKTDFETHTEYANGFTEYTQYYTFKITDKVIGI
jgi:hypothetical protein